MDRCDVAIVGGGIIGCACALAAAEAGLHVVLLEAGAIGAGATAASMGHLVVLDDNPWELALARWSMDCLTAWLDLPGIDHRVTGTLWLAETDGELATLRSRQARLHASRWPAHTVDAGQLRAAEPALSHHLLGALLVPQDAVLYPPRLAVGLAHRAQARGADVREGRRVVQLQAGSVALDDGTHLTAGHVLVAAGCGSPALLPGLPLHGRRGHLMVTDRYPGTIAHQLVESGYLEAAHGNAADSVSVNLQPRSNGQLLVGSTRDAAGADAPPSPDVLGRLARRAARFLPALAGMQVLRAWTGVRPTSHDDLPYIGRWPAMRDVWVAAGHEGLGITTAAATAQLWLSLLLDRPTPIDAAPCAPARCFA